MRIEIWSDIACPWCFIGKRRFERGLSSLSERTASGALPEFQITWRSFELDPKAPAASDESLVEMLSKKYGISQAQALQMQERVASVGAEEGISFRFDQVVPTNTFDAHRLLHFAQTKEKQNAMKERLLTAYFTDGIALSDHQALATLAGEAGLDVAETSRVLASGDFSDAVRSDEQRARTLGIRGVPFFLFNGTHAVSGAQPPEVFVQVLEELLRERESPDIDQGPGCGDDGCEL